LLDFPRRKPNSCGITLLAHAISRLFLGVAAITTVWGLPSNSVNLRFPGRLLALDELPHPPILVWPPSVFLVDLTALRALKSVALQIECLINVLISLQLGICVGKPGHFDRRV
jgi:hypothetical protein